MSRISRSLSILACICALAALGLLSACTAPWNAASSSNAGNSASSGTLVLDALSVTDAYGRQISLPAAAQTVATVGSGARIVVYAGAQSKLIAVTDMDKTPTLDRPYTIACQQLFASLPSTSNGNHLNQTEVDAEALLALHPDLIVSSRSAAECDQLQELLGIPVLGVVYQDEIFTDNVKTSILAVGTACGTSAHAQDVLSAMDSWCSELQQARLAAEAASLSSTSVPVYLGAVNYKGSKGLTGTTANSPILELIGIPNVADASGQSACFDTDLEQILAWNPATIFICSNNLARVQSEFAATPALRQLAAVQSGRLYQIPQFNSNGSNLELGIYAAYCIGSACYPQAFPFQLDAKASQIFQTLLGADISPQLKAAGLDFQSIVL